MPSAPSLFEQLNAALASGEAEDAIKGVKVREIEEQRKKKTIESRRRRDDGQSPRNWSRFRAATGMFLSRSLPLVDEESCFLCMLELTKDRNKRTRGLGGWKRSRCLGASMEGRQTIQCLSPPRRAASFVSLSLLLRSLQGQAQEALRRRN